MNPTAEARRQLLRAETLLLYKKNPPTTLSLLRKGWRQAVFQLLVGALSYFLFRAGGWETVAWALLATAIATLGRDLRWYYKISSTWGMSAEFTDWPKVEAAVAKLRTAI